MNVIKMPEQNCGNRVSTGELVALAQRRRACEERDGKKHCRGIACEGCPYNTTALLNGLDPYQRQWVEWKAMPIIDTTPWYDKAAEAVGVIVSIGVTVVGIAGAAVVCGIFGWIIWRVIKGL